MPVLNLSRIAAFALSACLLAPASSAQGAGAGGETPQAAVLRPEIRTGKVIATLPEAQGTDVEARSAGGENRLKKRVHVACLDIEVSMTEEVGFWNGSENVGGHRVLMISCGSVYDPPPNSIGNYSLRRGSEVFFKYYYLPTDPAAQGLAGMYLSMAQDAMRLDRSLRIDYVQCDDRFGPAGCWNQIHALTLYNDRRTNGY